MKDVENQSMSELLAEMQISAKYTKRNKMLKCLCLLLKLFALSVVTSLFVYICYVIYVYFFGTTSFLSSVIGSVQSVTSCAFSWACIRGNDTEMFYAPVRDPDPTLVEFIETYEKCERVRFGAGTSHWSERLILASCGCDVTQEAFRDIKNCTFSGNFTATAKHCIGMDVPDCKTHIAKNPEYAGLPRAKPIISNIKVCPSVFCSVGEFFKDAFTLWRRTRVSGRCRCRDIST